MCPFALVPIEFCCESAAKRIHRSRLRKQHVDTNHEPALEQIDLAIAPLGTRTIDNFVSHIKGSSILIGGI